MLVDILFYSHIWIKSQIGRQWRCPWHCKPSPWPWRSSPWLGLGLEGQVLGIGLGLVTSGLDSKSDNLVEKWSREQDVNGRDRDETLSWERLDNETSRPRPHARVKTRSAELKNIKTWAQVEVTRHGSITLMPITIKLQLHLILPISITITIILLVACKNRYGVLNTFLHYCPPALIHLLHETKHYSSVSSVNVNFTCCT